MFSINNEDPLLPISELPSRLHFGCTTQVTIVESAREEGRRGGNKLLVVDFFVAWRPNLPLGLNHDCDDGLKEVSELQDLPSSAGTGWSSRAVGVNTLYVQFPLQSVNSGFLPLSDLQ